MASPFQDWLYRDAEKRLEGFDRTSFAEAKAMAFDDEPDQWTCGGAAGSGFLGPTASGAAAGSEAARRMAQSASGLINARLQAAFTPEDVLQEVVGRRTDAVTAKPPSVRYQVRRRLDDGEEPTPEEQARLDEMAPALDAWADERGLDGLMSRAVAAACCFQRAYLRVFVPDGRLTEEVEVELTEEVEDAVTRPSNRPTTRRVLGVDSPAEALRHVQVQLLLPDTATIYADPGTQYRAAVALFEEENRKSAVVSYVDPGATDEARGGDDVLAVYPRTILKTLTGSEPDAGIAVPLRGRHLLIPIHDHALFLDGVMRKLQKAANTASTERRIVNDDAGFPVRLLLNAMPPGSLVLKEGPDTKYGLEAGQKAWVHEESELVLRPGGVVMIGGLPIYDPKGRDSLGRPVRTGTSTPSAQQWDAADSDHYRREVEDRIASILRRARQLFVLISGDATASGVSRQQALTDFLQDAERLARIVDRAGKALYEVAWDLACHLAGAPARDYDLEVLYECRLTAPPRTPGEMASAVTMKNEGLWSRRRAQMYVGVDDPESEQEEIEREGEAEAERLAADTARILGGVDDDRPEGTAGDGLATETPELDTTEG